MVKQKRRVAAKSETGAKPGAVTDP